MNRLVIIGNGFDLAHGLPTSYRDFIDDFWKCLIENWDKKKSWSYKNEIVEIRFEFTRQVFENVENKIKDLKTYGEIIEFINSYSSGHNPYQYDDKNNCKIKFLNHFFKIICERSLNNWVDIENVYFEILKSIAIIENKKTIYPNDIYHLNKEFNLVKDLLEKYLLNKVEGVFINKLEIKNPILGLLKQKSFELEDFSERDQLNIKENNQFNIDNFDGMANSIQKLFVKSKMHILNFNYTSTIINYIKYLESKKIFNIQLNHIHGILSNESYNKINFGFGDEMDDDYKMIENINNNEYLRNFKSFQYLQNSNYKNLLDFIDSEYFQVYLIGHSCGLSDRTLLNTIFEHENCRSIKPFYYEIRNEEGKVVSDNYTEIVQNISRHFNDKKLMREKIVNKTLCKPLPQIQLPKK